MATATLTQTVDLSGAAPQIDTGTLLYTLSGWLGGFLNDGSAASVTVSFLAADQSRLGMGTIGSVTALERGLKTALLKRETSGTIPAGTRSAGVVVTLTDRNQAPSNYNNATPTTCRSLSGPHCLPRRHRHHRCRRSAHSITCS